MKFYFFAFIFFSTPGFAADELASFKFFLKEMVVKNNSYAGAILEEEAAIDREDGLIGLYMPTLSAGFSRVKSYNSLTFDKSWSDTKSVSFGGKIPQLGLNYSSTLYSDTKTVQPEPVVYAGAYSYTLSLNLLKDFGPRVGWIPFKQVEITRDIAYYNKVKNMYAMFGELLSAYTSALAAQKNLLINIDSEKKSIEELKKSEELFKAGRIPKLSLLALQAQTKQVRSQVLGQERSVKESFRNLYKVAAIETDVENIDYSRALEPLPEIFDLSVIDALVNKPLDFNSLKNPDFHIGKMNLERAGITLTQAKNGVWPSLDLSYTKTGSKSNYPSPSPLFPREIAGETVALTFSVPLGLFTERNELSATRKEYIVADLTFSQLKRQLYRDWDNLCSQYKLLQSQLEIARSLVQVAKEKYEASLPTGQLGSTYQQNVITFQNEWVSAQVNLNAIEVEFLQIQLSVLSFHTDRHLVNVLNKLKV